VDCAGDVVVGVEGDGEGESGEVEHSLDSRLDLS